MRSSYSLLFLALVSLCTACNLEAFFDEGETFFEGRVTYKDSGEAAQGASVIIGGTQDTGFSGGNTVSSDTIQVDSEGRFEKLIEDHNETDYYYILVMVNGSLVEVKDYNCNDNVNSCAGLRIREEHSVIIEI